MKELTILSGKGGTGKTSITAALASVASNSVYCDNDVDAADLHLVFQPKVIEKHKFTYGWITTINPSNCNSCGLCEKKCRFDAIEYSDQKYNINPFKCEGCRLCERICPQEAISSVKNDLNEWYVSHSRFGILVHAQMHPGEENSGKLVTEIRKRAKEIALEQQAQYVINDGPPGIGCAAISSVSGTNKVLLVIEPTISGFSDVQRLVELVKTFNVEVFALINKYDINEGMTSMIANFLATENIPLLAKIAFDSEMVGAMVEGKTIVEFNPTSIISKQIKEVWKILKQ